MFVMIVGSAEEHRGAYCYISERALRCRSESKVAARYLCMEVKLTEGVGAAG